MDRSAEFQVRLQQARAAYPTVVAEIDSLVEKIANQVASLPSAELLQLAWWKTVERRMLNATESSVDDEDGLAQRMLDYVQSVIAAVPRAVDQRDLEEHDWDALKSNVASLFHRINFDYMACRSAVAAEDSQFNLEVEAFKVKAQMYWCNVRGQRYQYHEIAHLREMFEAHEDVFQRQFGISAQKFVDEMAKLHRNLSGGILNAAIELGQFQSDVERAVATQPDPESGDAFARAVVENGWEERAKTAIGRTLGLDAFDVELICELPKALLELMSWKEGEDSEFFAEGEMRGWPLKVWPVFRRPFITIGDRTLCFDYYSLFTGLYRVMQKIIQHREPSYKQTWNEVQAKVAEQLPFKYLVKLLPGATVFQSVYYPLGGSDWAEVDGVLTFEDYLFVVEVKAGAFTMAPPASNFQSYVASLERLVQAPAQQGQRFLKYVEATETACLFDNTHKRIGEISHAAARQRIILTVTLDPFTELASRGGHLKALGIHAGQEPAWSVSIDDLRVFADVFDNPLRFCHYVEQRLAALKTDVVDVEDELDHVGLYVEHNNYSQYAVEQSQASGQDVRPTFFGYRDSIDQFFSERFAGSDCAPPRQQIPPQIEAILSFLTAKNPAPGRARLACEILNWSGELRLQVANWIDQELVKQVSTLRPQPFSTMGEVSVTVYCWSPVTKYDATLALEHTRAVYLIRPERARLLLQLSYDSQRNLIDISWDRIDLSTIPPAEHERLHVAAEELRRKRVSVERAKRAISPFEPCPCGASKKYKWCCSQR